MPGGYTSSTYRARTGKHSLPPWNGAGDAQCPHLIVGSTIPVAFRPIGHTFFRFGNATGSHYPVWPHAKEEMA